MKSKNALYWTALIIGTLLVWLAVIWSSNTSMEHFQSAPSTSTDVTTPVEFNEITDEYAKFALSFPGYSATPGLNKLFVYLSSFSRKTQTNEDVYDKSIMKWRNMMDIDGTVFTLQTNNTVTLPDSLISSTNEQGLNLKGITLVGPQSDEFKQDSSYELPSFSTVFFMKWTEQDLVANTEYVMFEMFAESPNHVSWKVVRKDATTARVDVVLGNYNTTYSWDVPISTLMSNGYYTLYCLTFDKAEKQLTMYVGPAGVYRKTLSTVPVVLLANTPVSINKNKTLPVSLRAFAFLKGIVLTQPLVTSLNEYFVKMSNGAQSLLSQAQQQVKDATETTVVIQQRLDATQQTVNDLMSQLDKCKLKPESGGSNVAIVPPQNKWNISADMLNGVLPSESLKSCSGLHLKNFGDEATSSPFTKQVPPELAGKYAPRRPFTDYDINNPTRASSSNESSPSPSPTPAPSTVAPPAPSSPSVPSRDTAFWQGLLDAWMNSQSASQSNVTNQNANSNGPLYDEMRSSITGEQLAPGGSNVSRPSSTSSLGSTPTTNSTEVQQVSIFQYLKDFLS